MKKNYHEIPSPVDLHFNCTRPSNNTGYIHNPKTKDRHVRRWDWGDHFHMCFLKTGNMHLSLQQTQATLIVGFTYITWSSIQTQT